MQPDPWLLPDIQCTHTLRPINLMPADRHQVDVHVINIDWDFANALRPVGVQQNFLFSADLTDLFDGLNDTDLVVNEDD